MTRKRVEDIPPDLHFEAREPRFRIPKGWVNSALVLAAAGGLLKAGQWIGNVETRLQAVDKNLEYIRSRIDGITPPPQKLPLTSSWSDPVESVLKLSKVESDTPEKTAAAYEKLPGRSR